MPLTEEEKAELVAYLDGELDDDRTQAIETRLATDPDARAELDALKQTWGMLDFLPKASPSPNFTNKTMELLTKEGGPAPKTQPMPRPRSSATVAVGWAAAVLVAACVGYVAVMNYWPTPQPDPIPDADLPVMQHLRVLEKWRYYENTDDLDFVKKLNHPDLFGEDPS